MTLFELIQNKLYLGNPNSRGWYEIRCAVCNDHSPRFGFYHDEKFTSGYCWNCQAKFKVQEGTGHLSKAAREILYAFGITNSDLQELTSPLFLKIQKEPEISLSSLKQVKLNTPEVSFPENTYKLFCDILPELQIPIIEYIKNRKINPEGLYFSLNKRFLQYVIIPFWRDKKLIYWQARAIENVKRRYLNCEISRDAVLYGYDILHHWSDIPLFCSEGVFDAISINGIATLGALSTSQIKVLRTSRRRLIFVIDRNEPGLVFGQVALKNGWEITVPDIRASDINHSVQLFGLPYTIYCLMKNISFNDNTLAGWILEARLRFKK